MIFVNFKTYQSGTGERAVRMAKVVEQVSRESGIEMAVAVQAVDVYRISQEVIVPVYVQHVDAIEYGAHTGWVLPEAVKEAGAVGVMINHSERKVGIMNHESGIRESDQSLDKIVQRCKDIGLKTLICAADVKEVKQILKLDPDFLAYEPPELIGGKVSVSSAQPDIVRQVVDMAGQERILIGAGIHSAEDIKVGLELGAFGFLIASDVMLAKDPEERLRELVKGYQES